MPGMPIDRENRFVLTEPEKEAVVAALRTNEEDYAAGRWISLEDYEAQTSAQRQARGAAKDDK